MEIGIEIGWVDPVSGAGSFFLVGTDAKLLRDLGLRTARLLDPADGFKLGFSTVATAGSAFFNTSRLHIYGLSRGRKLAGKYNLLIHDVGHW